MATLHLDQRCFYRNHFRGTTTTPATASASPDDLSPNADSVVEHGMLNPRKERKIPKAAMVLNPHKERKRGTTVNNRRYKIDRIERMSLIIPFFFFFFSSCCATSRFSFCSTSPCDPQLLALADIANAFQNTTYLASYWNFTYQQNFCFWIALRCDTFRNIITINLGGNNLKGTISPSFSNFTFLKYLYLDHNNLTGPVPESLTKLSRLRSFDISDNNITGPIPNFDASVRIDTSGNPLLQTSSSIPPNGPNEAKNKTNNGNNNDNDNNSTKVISIIVVAIMCLVVVLGLGFIFFKCYANNGWGQGVQTDMNNESTGQIDITQDENNVFSIELLQQATNHFHQDNILGRGGFGVVYRGELHDGRKVAIEKMDSRSLQTRGLNEFQAEVDVLTRVRHRNLLALLAYCVHGNERFLVYEYMPQGTLTQHLFNWEENGYSPLTWKQRIIIALDVARGVEYLHSLAHQSFIHRDLKPSNILLDDDLRAKVADFGLVKRAPEGQSSMETKVAGTLGYLAPEYAVTGRVTTKVDVYAFGTILMEIITGRRALDNSIGEDEAHLVSWLRQVLINNENIQNVIDQTLTLDEENIESIQKVVELAKHCTADERDHRPDMTYVVNILNSLMNQWTPTIPEEEEETDQESHLHRRFVGEETSTFQT